MTRTYRIALLQAPLGRKEPLIYPLGIATLAAYLQGHELHLLDPNQMEREDMESTLRRINPDIIGISIRNIDSQMRRDLFYYFLYLKQFVREVRALCPESRIILGGSGFSLFPAAVMQKIPEAELGVYLEADESLPALIDSIDRPESVPGVYYRNGGELHFTGAPRLPDIEHLPLPRYDLLDPRPYARHGGVGIQTKRGCPLGCIYCTYPQLNGSCLRLRPIDAVIDEIRALQGYGVNEITFVDGVFNLPKDRAVAIVTRMHEERLAVRWHGWFTERGMDRDFMALCRDTGCREFSFSPDAYDDRLLERLGKSIRTSDIDAVVEHAMALDDVSVAFNFFWNPPGQTVRSFLKMIRFAIRTKLKLKSKAGGIIFGDARIEPHTPLWTIAVQEGVIDPQWDLLPDTVAQLHETFYMNRRTRFLDGLFSVYSGAWRMKRLLRPGRSEDL